MSFGKPKDDRDYGNNASSAAVSFSSTTTGSSNSRSEAFLGRGTKVVGTLNFQGIAEIECVVEGEVLSQDRLTIGEGGAVKGKITGAEVVIRGEVIGDIIASKRLAIRRPAKVVGNISAPLLSIEEGVSFEGKCSMVSASQGSSTSSMISSKSGAVVAIAERAA